MPAKFEIKTAKNGKYFFNLQSGNGETILTSQMYASKATAKKGIESVKTNGRKRKQFDEKKTKAGKHYFVLKAANHQVVGNGQSYSGNAAMQKGIAAVVKNVAKATIEDLA